MGKHEELKPSDSKQNLKKDKQVVKRSEDKRYDKDEADLANPATTRKYSEQPPIKHNSKT
ncbi:hypothetical protein [Parapedobacter luteus]|uniref:hypothetical protein n=1 Tax=Parapedobacter luteus TaxID=623280 RepID=UPI0009A72C8D|nr:hypothetical protein [Parapedobacter luteus]